MFGAFAAGFGLGGGAFAASYRVYPVSFLDRPDAEAGDKLFLPPSALDRLGGWGGVVGGRGAVRGARPRVRGREPMRASAGVGRCTLPRGGRAARGAGRAAGRHDARFRAARPTRAHPHPALLRL